MRRRRVLLIKSELQHHLGSNLDHENANEKQTRGGRREAVGCIVHEWTRPSHIYSKKLGTRKQQ